MEIRSLEPDDMPFLHEMFMESAGWRNDEPRPNQGALMAIPELARYMAGWPRPGDAALIAYTLPGDRIGAAWYRLFNYHDRGYGFVSSDIPELGIAVCASNRGRGVGRSLMLALAELAVANGHPALSLSVHVENLRAVKLYESLGFQRVGTVEEAWTMLLRFAPTP